MLYNVNETMDEMTMLMKVTELYFTVVLVHAIDY